MIFDERDTEILYSLLKHYVHLVTKEKLDPKFANIAFDFMKEIEDCFDDAGEAAEDRKHDHIDYTNWRE